MLPEPLAFSTESQNFPCAVLEATANTGLTQAQCATQCNTATARAAATEAQYQSLETNPLYQNACMGLPDGGIGTQDNCCVCEVTELTDVNGNATSRTARPTARFTPASARGPMRTT